MKVRNRLELRRRVMKTNLDVGAIVVIRDGGRFLLWQVCDSVAGGKAITTVDRALAAGETVYRGVWKGETLEARECHVLRDGDAVWLDTGTNPFDSTKPPTSFGFQVDKTRTIHVNRFERGPVWLRKAE